jgi:hypothetical protein
MYTRHVVVAALSAVLFLGGCTNQVSSSGAEPGASMSTPSSLPSPSSSPSPSPGGSESVSPPSRPAGSTSPLTLTGQVEAGVETGCLILKDGGKTYLLFGGDPGVVHAGARVRVSGRLVPDLMSSCMQGLSFQVSEAHPA